MSGAYTYPREIQIKQCFAFGAPYLGQFENDSAKLLPSVGVWSLSHSSSSHTAGVVTLTATFREIIPIKKTTEEKLRDGLKHAQSLARIALHDHSISGACGINGNPVVGGILRLITDIDCQEATK